MRATLRCSQLLSLALILALSGCAHFSWDGRGPSRIVRIAGADRDGTVNTGLCLLPMPGQAGTEAASGTAALTGVLGQACRAYLEGRISSADYRELLIGTPALTLSIASLDAVRNLEKPDGGSDIEAALRALLAELPALTVFCRVRALSATALQPAPPHLAAACAETLFKSAAVEENRHGDLAPRTYSRTTFRSTVFQSPSIRSSTVHR